MSVVQKAIAFTIASTAHGTMIVPVRDYNVRKNRGWVDWGVGLNLLQHGEYDTDLISLCCGVLQGRYERDPCSRAVAIDGGANIGVYTIEWARFMAGWGRVIAFEPQRWIFNCLAGNVALNGCFNADVQPIALGGQDGFIGVPHVDYGQPGHYSSLSLNRDADIGQDRGETYPARMRTIDGMGLGRLDVLKLDIEGMEIEALEGARQTIMRCRPFITVEWIHVGEKPLRDFMDDMGYRSYAAGLMLACLHRDDPMNEIMAKLAEGVKVPA